MSLVRFKAKNHPQQLVLGVGRDEVDDRALPLADFAKLQARFNFTIDVASSDENRKLPRHLTPREDGLKTPWTGERVYCNPPYSNIGVWVKKAWAEIEAPLIVMLLPANRTEQRWWQDSIEPVRDRAGSVLSVEFLAGRQRFLRQGQKEIGPNERPPFGLCLCIWRFKP